jgi:hypothetical protein
MKKQMILSAAGAVVLAAGAVGGVPTAAAQHGYTYTVTQTRRVLIDWRPEQKEYSRYTVSVSPLRLVSHGVKFDFEFELPRPGHWFGTSLQLYLAPARRPLEGYFWDPDGNNRASFNSAFDEYHRMWGIGTSAFYKNTFARRGWYFSAGVTLDFYRVGVMAGDYAPYTEDGLQFYEYGTALRTHSYFKPTMSVNIGKHMAISERCYFDLYAGVGYSHAFFPHDYDADDRGGGGWGDWGYRRFGALGGFAYRGLIPTGGFRFGVLLWKKKGDE